MRYHLASAIVLTGLITFTAMTLMKKPRADREWSPPLAKVASFEQTGASQYRLHNLRAFEYGPQGAQRKEWGNAKINVQNLTEIWFFIEPFTGSPVFAHSFLSFVFEDENSARQTLSISIEARKEAGEPYSAIRGAMLTYELLYVWSTEKDILTRISIKLDHKLYAYKLDIAQDRMKVLFDYFVKRTNTLAAAPRFYNTLYSNCTNELAKSVNDAYPGALPWHRSWVMTGRSAKWLHKLGFIGDQDTPFTDITAQSDIQTLIKEHALQSADIFSDRWREAFQITQ